LVAKGQKDGMPEASDGLKVCGPMTPRDIALACCPPIIWSLSYVFAKPAIAHFPPLFMIGLAYAVGAIVLLRQALKSNRAAGPCSSSLPLAGPFKAV
jgi:drug/metabolite transporter (DMT)-like permease